MSKVLVAGSISASNFMKYGDVECTFTYTDQSLAVVVGPNGNGKSSLPIDALFYNWYGKTFRKGGKLPKLVNTTNKKDMTTKSMVTSANGDEYMIIRNYKPDLFQIHKKESDGSFKLITPTADLRDYQKWLTENVLNMSAETFKQVVVLGSSSYVPFMELDTSARRSVVEDLLSLRIYSHMNTITKERVKTLKVTHKELATKAVSAEHVYDAHCSSLKEVQSRSETFVEDSSKKVEALIKEIESINAGVSGHSEQIDTLKASIADMPETKQKYQQSDIVINQEQGNISRINQSLSFYEGHTNCPECEQKLHSDFVEAKVKTLNENKVAFNTNLVNINQEKEKLRERLVEIKAVVADIQKLQGEVTEANQQVSIRNSNINSLQQNINSFQMQDTTQIEAKIDQAKADWDKIKVDFAETKKRLDHHTALADLLGDKAIKADVIRKYLPIINQKIDEFMQIIGFNCIFTLDEAFKETIILDGAPTEYANLSQGQKLRLNMVLLFVWREVAKHKNSASCNLLIMDEVLNSSLDADGLDAVFKLIYAAIKKGGENIVVISHDPETQGRFSHVYEVKLDKGHSTITKQISTN